jgi:hypothetical protein
MVLCTMLLPVSSACISQHFCHNASQVEVTHRTCHLPFGLVNGLTLLLATNKISLDGGVIFDHTGHEMGAGVIGTIGTTEV